MIRTRGLFWIFNFLTSTNLVNGHTSPSPRNTFLAFGNIGYSTFRDEESGAIGIEDPRTIKSKEPRAFNAEDIETFKVRELKVEAYDTLNNEKPEAFKVEGQTVFMEKDPDVLQSEGSRALKVEGTSFFMKEQLSPLNLGDSLDFKTEKPKGSWFGGFNAFREEIPASAVLESRTFRNKELSIETLEPSVTKVGKSSTLMDGELSIHNSQSDSKEKKASDSFIAQKLPIPLGVKRLNTTPDILLTSKLRHKTIGSYTRLNLQRRRSETEDAFEFIFSNFLESDCNLIIAADRRFHREWIFEELVSSASLKQIVFVESSVDLEKGVVWKSPRCQRILLLASDPGPLVEFGNKQPFLWDYTARVLIFGLTEESLAMFMATKKGRKTHHIVGVVKGDRESRPKIFINKLWSGDQLIQIPHWKRSTSEEGGALFPDKISNFHRAALNVIVFEWQPAIIYHRDQKGNLLLRYGRDTAIVETLSEVFNFTIVYKEPRPDELWGSRHPNGSYNGMVGLLASGQGDLAIANLFITALDGRREYQEFSTPFADDQGCYMARVDPPLPRWLSPVLPFQAEAWMALLLGLILSGPILYGLIFLGNKLGDRDSISTSLLESVFITYAVHFGQPVEISSRGSSTRIFTCVLLFYIIIITTGYKSNLTAFFTISRQPASIETFKDLHESGLKVLGISYDKILLQSSENQYLRDLVSRFEVKPHFNEMKSDVLTGKAVATGSKRYLEMAEAQITTARGEPLVRIMKECFSTNTVAIGYPRNSPLKPRFDEMITRMFEGGLVTRWFQNSIRQYQKRKKQARKVNNLKASGAEAEEDGATPLGMEHVQGVFLLLIFGYAISAMFLIIELCNFGHVWDQRALQFQPCA